MAAHVASQGRKCPDPPRSPHRPAATHVSMATTETASKDGEHLWRPGSRAGPRRGQEVGDAWMKDGPSQSITVTQSSPPLRTVQGQPH